MRGRLFIMLVVAALVGGSQGAGAARRPSGPLAVQSASLTQSGRDLVWTVAAQSPFSPAALNVAGQALCLVIERRDNGTAAGQLCLIGPRPPGRSPRLAYQQITRAGPGPPRVIAATLTRAGARQLTASFLAPAIGDAYRSVRWQVLSRAQPGTCPPSERGPHGCVTLFPGRPALALLHTPALVGCTAAAAPAVAYAGPPAGRMIALTFDDGPWYQTPQFLALLEHYHVPATFFEIGEQIAAFGRGGAIERRMLADGDMIGDHTWSHRDVAAAGAFARGQIEDAAGAIRAATRGFTPCLFRPPFGALSPSLIGEVGSLGFTTVQWNIDPRDWALPGVAHIESNVIDNARPGAIVELHDGGGNRSQTLAALPDIITTLRGRGYRFVTVTQLLGLRVTYR